MARPASGAGGRRTTARASRRREQQARRDSAAGIGPAGEEPTRLAGATNRFALFGEVLVVGALVTVASIPLVTVPLALALGSRHLRRYVRAEDTSASAVLAELRRGLLPSLVVGLVVVLLTALLVLDLALAVDRVLPGAEVVLVLGVLGALALALAVLTGASRWDPATGWRAALRAVPAAVRDDPGGAVYLLVAAAFVGVVTWQLPPLVLPGLGLLVFAMVAVPERPRR